MSKKNKEKNTKKNDFLIGVLILLIIVLLGIILYLEKDNLMKLFNKDTNTQNESTSGEVLYSSLTKEDTSKFNNTLEMYESEDGFCYYDDLNECEKKDKKLSIKVEGENAKILDTYYTKYVFYSDNNKIKVYDNEKNNSYIINISSKFYSYFFGVDDVTKEFVGIVYRESEKDNASYYSIKENKTLYNKKYTDLEFLSEKYLNASMYEDIEKEDYSETILKEAYLLSTNNEKILLSVENEPIDEDYYIDKGYTILYNKNATYVCLAAYEDDEIIEKIYTDNLKLIVTNENYIEASIAENGNLYVLNNKVVDVYDKDGKKIKTSREYGELLQLFGEYFTVIENNKLILTTIDEKAIEITNWNKNKSYHSGLSGWYSENGKYGIYMVVEESVSASEVYNYCSKHNSCDDMDLNDIKVSDRGYEYYYVPETGETGKIPTYIGGYAKPILYLYPTENTNLTVTFSKPDNLTTTYPKYVNSWNVIASSNGDLYDQNGRYYYGLYWEEKLNHKVDFSEGFYVSEENAIEFLESKLSIIGLNERESNEFIMYWLPILEKNKHSLVYFELTKERDSYSKINISPKPDSMLRIAIHVKKVSGYTPIKEEKLVGFNRTGFSAVEWGGVIY